ncbi:MAG: hypothetical protein JXB38_18325 [Anaerolineales bacterium]|nr:hypothetical protein [Anaerolineales bacterium]
MKDFQPYFWTTLVGSFPHTSPDSLYKQIIEAADIPIWPQLPKRDFRESMYVQYSRSLPRVVVNAADEKIYVDTEGDLSQDLESFYEKYLADDADTFGFSPKYAEGFFATLETVKSYPGEWIKGQVTGPISLGLTVTDQNLRSILYHELLADIIVKNAAMNARWQIKQLSAVRPNTIIFVDEPYMASYGSAFISLSREQVITMLDEVFDAIHQEGGLAGVHCCANTDWSVLLDTCVDILNLDAYGYLDNLALYPQKLKAFLDRGGVLAWGIIPSSEHVYENTPDDLSKKLIKGLKLISQKAQAKETEITLDLLKNRSLITTSCGLGPTNEAIVNRVFEILPELKTRLREQL